LNESSVAKEQRHVQQDSADVADSRQSSSFLGTVKVAWSLFLFAVTFSAVAGAVGDFFSPKAPVNSILCLGSATISFLLFWLSLKFRRQGLGLAFFCLLVAAAGFGTWWTLAEFKGDPERGFLAEHLKVISKLQVSILHLPDPGGDGGGGDGGGGGGGPP
jgi:hypothetical protein